MTKLRITDHALVRFLERAGGLDIEALRGVLASSLSRAADAAHHLGVSKYVIVADGLLYIIEGSDLVTVMPDEGQSTHLRATRQRR